MSICVVSILSCLACSQEPTPATLQRVLTSTPKVAAELLEPKPAIEQGERRKQKRFAQDTPVYVDGEFKGMLKFSELPPSVVTRFQSLDDGRLVRRFAWADYFGALGVDLEAVRQAHFYGGRHSVCMVDGEEIRRASEGFRFSFTRSDAGHPRMEPPEGGIRYNTAVDKIRAVAVYVNKPPPRYQQGKLHFGDGRVEPVLDDDKNLNIPYSDGERHGGTRVYLDGRFVATFRRRALRPALLDGSGPKGPAQFDGSGPKGPAQFDGSGPKGPELLTGGAVEQYSLARTLESFGVALGGVRQAQLIGPHDGLLAELGEQELRAFDGLSFTLGQQSRGKIAVASVSDERLHAIVLFAKTKPADRAVPHARMDGSNEHQGRGEILKENVTRLAARTLQ